jgi:hypothetical protein
MAQIAIYRLVVAILCLLNSSTGRPQDSFSPKDGSTEPFAPIFRETVDKIFAPGEQPIRPNQPRLEVDLKYF